MAAPLDLWSLLLGQGAATQASSDETLQLSRRHTYVVVLDAAPAPTALTGVVRQLLDRVTPQLQPRQLYDQLGAFSVDLDDTQVRRLRAQNGIRSIEADRPIPAMPPVTVQPGEAELQGGPVPLQLTSYGNTTSASGETLPWGVRAVWNGIDVGSRGNIGTGTTVFVIDSGVLATTGDLNLNTAWSRSWIAGESAFSDGVGHGTHVAGTIAALANGIGVVGVAPGAEVVSLKVFANSGGGATITSIIDAINHAVGVINSNGLDRSKVVINMSLGGGLSSSLTNAIVNAANQGIRFSIAAGNSGQDADGFSPANAGDHPNVYTVSAVDSAYRMASWSNWDRVDASDAVDDVDLAAPGVGVLSYYQGGQLANLSGTSMAAPHVAGLLLTGGVSAGSLTTASVEGTADPFALAASTVAPTPGQVRWGTTGSDSITGTSGNDRLSGVLASGTTAKAMGANQVDVLTGGAGADVFVLGDKRGVFYDNRINGNPGLGDYARLQDFQSGVDKLQLASGRYLTSTSQGNTSLYWDRNGNGRLNLSGSNQDELVAILTNATLSGADVIWA